MKYGKSAIKTTNKAVKFLTVALLCFFCVLIANYYYYVKNYTATLYKNLNIIIFLDESFKEDTIEKIKSTDLVFVREYINASEAYSKAIEKNPFLKDILVPNDARSIQAYVIAAPKFMPEKNSLLNMKKTLERISGVDEIVFDMSAFERYVEAKNLISLFRKIFFIFEIIIFSLFIFRCVFFVMEHKSYTRKFVINVFSYLLCSILGFLVFWVVCTCMHYPLLIDEITALLIIPFVAALGIVLD